MTNSFHSAARLVTDRGFVKSVVWCFIGVSTIFGVITVIYRSTKIPVSPVGHVSVLEENSFRRSGFEAQPFDMLPDRALGDRVGWSGFAVAIFDLCQARPTIAELAPLFEQGRAKLLIVAQENDYFLANAPLRSQECEKVIAKPAAFRGIYAVFGPNDARRVKVNVRPIFIIESAFNVGPSIDLKSIREIELSAAEPAQAQPPELPSKDGTPPGPAAFPEGRPMVQVPPSSKPSGIGEETAAALRSAAPIPVPRQPDPATAPKFVKTEPARDSTTIVYEIKAKPTYSPPPLSGTSLYSNSDQYRSGGALLVVPSGQQFAPTYAPQIPGSSKRPVGPQ
jgi:hypothetical protein